MTPSLLLYGCVATAALLLGLEFGFEVAAFDLLVPALRAGSDLDWVGLAAAVSLVALGSSLFVAPASCREGFETAPDLTFETRSLQHPRLHRGPPSSLR